MKRNFAIITIIITPLLIACSDNTKNFSFNTENHTILEQQLQNFIDSMESKDLSATAMFREENVYWWNSGVFYMDSIYGKPQYIPEHIPLPQIKGMQYLQIDSLYVSQDTIRGLAYMEPCGAHFGVNPIALILSEQHKISEIIYYHRLHWDCIIDKLENESNPLINGGSEYREWKPKPLTQAQLDSMYNHHNDYHLITD